MLQRLGRCTIVLYNEGMHVHEGGSEAATFRDDVREALGGMEAASAAVGKARATHHQASTLVGGPTLPVLAVWEVIAQHFDTPEKDGLFEHTVIFQKYNESTWNASHTLLGAYAYYSRAALRQHEQMCTETWSNSSADWRNVVLSEEAARMRHTQLLRFHQASQSWGPLLHGYQRDCSHVCYSRWFYVPLWAELARAVRNATSTV